MNISCELRLRRAKIILRRSVKFSCQTKFLAAFLMLGALSKPVGAEQSINLAWTQSVTPDVTGYYLMYGGASRTYTNLVDVGNVTNTAVNGLVAGATYYLAAVAYDAFGFSSVDSVEIVYTVPIIAPEQLSAKKTLPFTLTVSGTIGQMYDIQATSDFETWAVIGTVTLGTNGSWDFTDTNTVNFPQRFYRTSQTQP